MYVPNVYVFILVKIKPSLSDFPLKSTFSLISTGLYMFKISELVFFKLLRKICWILEFQNS